MTSTRKILARLARMSFDEMRTRASQEVSKRVDLALYRTNLLSVPNGLKYSEHRDDARFLLDENDLPNISQILREHLPEEVKTTIAEADEICRHRFRLLGYENLDYGAQIDWHLDAVHGKRAPLKPWFKIRFLEFDEVGDHKVTWELNRHQHFLTLAKAWHFTHDDKYVAELTQQFYSWQLANPYPMGINWGSSLEVAFRSLSWLWVRFLLGNCPAVPANFDRDLLLALAVNGRYIERYLSTYFSPNTHLLGEAVALFFIGTLCPQIASSKKWRDYGWQIVLQEAERQVRPDGVYFEQSLYYHVYALDFFLHARLLAERNGIQVPGSFDQILNRMLDVVAAVSQTGPPDSFGDDDGGCVFNPRRNRPEHLTDPLAIGAILYNRDDLRDNATLTEESVWLFGEPAIAGFSKRDASSRQLKPVAFEAGGIYVMASSEPCPQQMVIDAGPQGIGHSGHGHADALSLRVSLDGRRFLIDPGAFCYMCDDRNKFRGTAAHNTLRVDGFDQAVPEGTFAWSSLPEIRAERWLVGSTFTLFIGSHTGYSRLPDPVTHRRLIFHLHNGHLNRGFWFVQDVTPGRGTHQLEIFWHFAPDINIRAIENGFIAEPHRQNHNARPSAALTLLATKDAAWSNELISDFVSPAYGEKEPAPVVCVSGKVSLPASYATILKPLAEGSGGNGTLDRISEAGSAIHVYRYDEDESGGTHLMIFNDGENNWTVGRWSSDAKFVYFRMQNQQLNHLILSDGSYFQMNERFVLQHPQKIDRFEWDNRAGVANIFSSDNSAEQAFSKDVAVSCDSIF
jgi:hypothetical protein